MDRIKHCFNPEQKLCPMCKETKDHSEFPRKRQNKSGLDSYCKTCCQKRAAAAYLVNPEYYRKAGRERYSRLRNTDPEFTQKHLEDSRKWAKENPEKRRITQAHAQDVLRTKRQGAKGSYTIQEWKDLQADYGGRCAYCGAEGKLVIDLVIDHVVPLSKGGTNSIENIVPACKKCNYEKHNTNLLVWMWRKLNNPKVEVSHE